MSASIQAVLRLVVVVLGIVLIVGGIWTGKHGAVAAGIIVSGVAAQRWIALRKRSRSGEKV